MDDDRLFQMKYKPTTPSLPTVRKLMKIDHSVISNKQQSELQAINTLSSRVDGSLPPNVVFRANAATNPPSETSDKRNNFVVVELPKLPVSKKSKELPASASLLETQAKPSEESAEVKFVVEADDECEQQYMTVLSEEELPESPDQVMDPSKKFEVLHNPISTVDLSGINTIPSTQEIRMSGKRRSQKYRKAWESLPECQGWLQGIEGNVYKAKCTSCDKEMMADITVIRNHAQAKKHQKSCEYVQDENLSAILRKSFETAKRSGSKRSNTKATSWSTFEANINNDSDDIQIIDFDSLSIKGDEENEEYDYELEESEGKHYSNHSFTQPSKEKEKETVSQSKAVVSKLAPFWKASAIVNGHVTELKLSDYKGKYVVLIFYPQDFSRVCQSELLSVSDRISEFRALNADVVACSVDSYLAHQVWCRTPRGDGGLANPKIALLSDPTHSISKDYGCFMPELGHTLRAYYIIDYRGIIRNITINDIAVGRGTDELLRLVEAFQQTDETEACCPADWKSGQPLYS